MTFQSYENEQIEVDDSGLDPLIGTKWTSKPSMQNCFTQY